MKNDSVRYRPEFHFISAAWEKLREIDSTQVIWTLSRMLEKTVRVWPKTPH